MTRVLVRDAVGVVAGILAAATCLSWWLGTEHVVRVGNLITTVILAIAFTKIWVVGYWFMELRNAPFAGRAVFNAWILLVGGTVVAMST